MTTNFKCLLAFLLFSGIIFAQEQEISLNYKYTFQIENVNTLADDAIVKDIKTYSKDLFEVHPSFAQGKFEVATSFEVPTDRIEQYLSLYGFTVTEVVTQKDGKILTTKTKEK